MKVMKFGGTSVINADRIKNACAIIIEENKKTPVAAVFSAMKGTTDKLIEAADKAKTNMQEALAAVTEIRIRHLAAIDQLLNNSSLHKETAEEITAMLDELESIIKGIGLVKECSPRSLDLAASFGERLNCRIISAYLNSAGVKAEYVDAREIIVTDDNYTNAAVFFDESYSRIKARLNKTEGLPVITGFAAATRNGITTTIGRNGSDYTASIIGAGCGAEVIEIWTDVDGVLSADPRVVKNAFVIDEISVQEAMELSFFGAEVIHPYTMIPAVEKNIPIKIKNTLNPSAPGTVIAGNIKKHSRPITGIASISGAAIINIEGGGMMGKPGIASRVFSAFAKAGTNIVMISQASSEHSICIVIREKEADKALKALNAELETEVELKQIQAFEIKRDLEIIAIIGENMRGTPGISGKLFSALGRETINVLVIAQGSSERNISFVIKRDDRIKALNTIHRAFLEENN